MFLRSLSIENFRSMRRAELDFDDITLLIGENDSGKSSLFEALDQALAGGDRGPQFQAEHFHRGQGGPTAAPVGPICIELTFEERQVGEWNRIDLGVLKPLLKTDIRRPRRLVLRLTAAPPQDASPVEANWEIFSPGSKLSAEDAASLDTLRSLNRFVWLRGGSLLGSSRISGREPAAGRQLKADIAPLAEEIQRRYQALASGTSRHEQSELKAGYEAALELLSRRAVDSHSAGALSRSLVEEILGQRGLDAGQRAQAFHGSAAQQVGVLILTAAILRHHPGVSITGGEYIMVVEDPEAHLHLMTLASVWGLLDHLEAQKIISTQSGTLLAAAPLRSVRRLTRHEGLLRQWRVEEGSLKAEELRKLSYHVRLRRADASFARCWLLVEGETEFWMLPELARLCGYDLALEGVACVEFAQCGLTPLIKVARELGIEWHVLADGDKAGRIYADRARSYLRKEPSRRRVTALRQRDIEHCFWKHGYEQVFVAAAGQSWTPGSRMQPRSVINRAIRRHSKPYMAFELIVAAAAEGSPGVPAPLKRMLDTCVQLARKGVKGDA
jgi:putative ATP-dependent endonuclease of OLD family